MEIKNLDRIVYAILLAILIIVTPIVSPELASAVGGAFAEPLELVTNALAGIKDLVMQFDGDLYAFIISAGVSAPLTFAIVAALKKVSFFADYSSQSMATIVGLLLYGAMVFAQQSEQIMAYDNFVEIALLVLTMVVGTGATQFGASSIHDSLVNTSVAIAQPRKTES